MLLIKKKKEIMIKKRLSEEIRFNSNIFKARKTINNTNFIKLCFEGKLIKKKKLKILNQLYQ